MDFFVYLLSFLVAGLIFVFLFTSLGLGPILGYLVAGMVIGPFAVGIVQKPEVLLEVSELGLVLFLFLIGLELSPKRIWQMRRAVFALGPAQVILSGLSLSAMSLFWLDSLSQAFVIGGSLALSSTAIGMQLLSDKNEVTTTEGQNALGVLIFQDLAVIPFLAILPFLAPHSEPSAAPFSWMEILEPLSAIVVVVFAGIYIFPKILKFLARVHRHELFIVASLALVIAVAVLMHHMGLSMALGAFLTGVLLANSEFRHELEANIEPFKALLFGLFFISMGASLDLSFLQNHLVSLILASIGLLIFKTLSNFIAFFGLRLNACLGGARTAALLSQAGEFALVILGLAAGFGIIHRDVGTFCMGVVAASMALTPLWYKCVEFMVESAQKNKAVARLFDVVNPQGSEVIIAGYGRFGQIVHRILRLHQIPVTILEASHEHVEFVKKYGTKVFFGDATRLDLLKAAGAEKARLFVLAIDHPAASARAAEIIRTNFPDIPLFVRARNREHSLRLMSLGIPQTNIVRETLHSSLVLTEDILRNLGMSPGMASQTIQGFIEHDADVLANQVQYLDKEEEMIQFTTKSAAALQKIFEKDKEN